MCLTQEALCLRGTSPEAIDWEGVAIPRFVIYPFPPTCRFLSLARSAAPPLDSTETTRLSISCSTTARPLGSRELQMQCPHLEQHEMAYLLMAFCREMCQILCPVVPYVRSKCLPRAAG